ncbi:hypothetical protein STCU_07453 [Strigomonas culicis]|uniref:Post-transcriptional regulator MKT1 C-terminal domain-containing protein n=1 Tax=Strigomonas culicis TaxID=28005 RepID=S9U4B5_9TRYP|nr:hypothetical protein STCU_07453 [Strigomonas culicis]|eukprot:EPY23793.1 hypothetical protein STCU_07453 [Strigomonas culicis]
MYPRGQNVANGAPVVVAKAEEDSFKIFVEKNHLEKKGIPLSDLAKLPDTNCVCIGIDGVKVLNDITSSIREKNLLSMFTMSTPIATYEMVNNYCTLTGDLSTALSKQMKELKSLVIFDGCGFSPIAEFDPVAPIQPEGVLECNAHDSKTSVASVHENVKTLFAERFTIEDDLEGFIVRLVCGDCFPESYRAPYFAWSQLSANMAGSNKSISEVWGSLELLAFPGIDRVITNIDTQRETFDCVTREAVLAAVCRTSPKCTVNDLRPAILFSSKNKAFRVKGFSQPFAELCGKIAAQGASTFVNKEDLKMEQRILLQRNLSALASPVAFRDGTIVPLNMVYNEAKPPITIRNTFGRPLAPLTYYLMMRGPLVPAPFATLSQVCVANDWPLVDTSTYRKAAERLLPLRVQMVYQYFLHMKEMKPPLRWLRQYMVVKDKPNDRRWSPIESPPPIELAMWNLSDPPLAQDTQPYFSNVLVYSENGTHDIANCILPDLHSTVACALLQSIDLLGYFTHSMEGAEQSGLGTYAEALSHFDCPTLSEYGVLLIELIRTETLTDAPIQLKHNAPPRSYLPGLRFAARVLSIIPITVAAEWTGPFDPEIAAFAMCSRLVNQSLRVLTEVISSLLFTQGRTNLPISQFNNVVALLPFKCPVEIAAGNVMMFILSNRNCDIGHIKAAFPELGNLEYDLSILFWFWTMAYRALSVLHDDEYLETVLDQAHGLVRDAAFRLCPSRDIRNWFMDAEHIVQECRAAYELGMQQAAAEEAPGDMGMPPPADHHINMGVNARSVDPRYTGSFYQPNSGYQ